MDSAVWGGLEMAFAYLWLVPIGVLVGIVVGAVPGLSAGNTLAIFLPILITLPVEISIIFAVSLYVGAEVGGSYPAILLNIPGTGSAAVAAFDGYPMCQQNMAAQAMGISVFSSFVGGVLGGIVCLTTAPLISSIALKLSPVEMTIIILFGVAILAQLSAGGLAKGLMAGMLGLLIATTGVDPIWGLPRGTFGTPYLLDGMPVVPALIGLLAMSELFITLETGDVFGGDGGREHNRMGLKGIFAGFRMTIDRWGATVRASLIGVGIGAVPGAGATISSFVAYQQAIVAAPPEERSTFGKGNPSGVIAAEAANNGVVGGSLIPMITLGVPGSGTTAVLLVIMAAHGLNVGPRLLELEGNLVYAIFWTQFTAAACMLVLGTVCAYWIHRVAYISKSMLIPVVSVFALIGGFAPRQYTFDMMLVLVFGVIGYVMKKNKYPPAAMLLGIILGPLLEGNLLRGLMIGLGDPLVFFTRPVAVCLWAMLIGTFAIPPLWRKLKNTKNDK